MAIRNQFQQINTGNKDVVGRTMEMNVAFNCIQGMTRNKLQNHMLTTKWTKRKEKERKKTEGFTCKQIFVQHRCGNDLECFHYCPCCLTTLFCAYSFASPHWSLDIDFHMSCCHYRTEAMWYVHLMQHFCGINMCDKHHTLGLEYRLGVTTTNNGKRLGEQSLNRKRKRDTSTSNILTITFSNHVGILRTTNYTKENWLIIVKKMMMTHFIRALEQNII